MDLQPGPSQPSRAQGTSPVTLIRRDTPALRSARSLLIVSSRCGPPRRPPPREDFFATGCHRMHDAIRRSMVPKVSGAGVSASRVTICSYEAWNKQEYLYSISQEETV